MDEPSAKSRWLPRVSIRRMISLILVVALLLGWYSSQRRIERERRWQEQRLRYAEEELRRAKDQLQDQQRGPRPYLLRSFWEADLEGSNLAGMTIASNDNAFQRASFLQMFTGGDVDWGVSSFQARPIRRREACQGALTGGGSSFQMSSFLLGPISRCATLMGGGASFQCVISRCDPDRHEAVG